MKPGYGPMPLSFRATEHLHKLWGGTPVLRPTSTSACSRLERLIPSAKGGYRRSERNYGHFYRMIPLPQGAETDKAKAEFKDGFLQVRVPIPNNKRQSRQIQIAS